MVAIPKISIGTSTRKAHFDLTHDVNTTADFGFCQPTLVHDLIKDSKITLKPRVVVRPAPLPVPSWAPIELKQYTCFVPYRDVFKAWEFFQKNQSVSSGLMSYVPVTTDYLTNKQYFGILVYMASRFGFTSSSLNYDKTPFLGSLYINTIGHTTGQPVNYTVDGVTYNVYIRKGTFGLFDFDNNPFYATDGLAQNKLNTIWADYSYKYIQSFIDVHIFDATEYDVDQEVTFNAPFFVNWSYLVKIVNEDWNEYFFNVNTNVATKFLQQCRSFMMNARGRVLQMLSGSAHDYTTADYTKRVEMVAPKSDGVEIVKRTAVLSLKYTRFGQHLHKITTACGIGFKYEDKVNVLDLFAYYKGWFDKFNPQRNISWKDTACYKLIHGFYDKPDTIHDILAGTVSPISNRRVEVIINFFESLGNCYYVLAVDPITAITETPLLNSVIDDNDLVHQSVIVGEDDGDINKTSINAEYQKLYGSNVEEGGALQIKLLTRFMHLINKNSVLGANVSKYLQAMGISNGLPETTTICEDKLMINIDDVFSNINNEDTVMGEYAGKALGSAHFSGGKYTANEYGVLVQYTIIVPMGGYAQAVKRSPIKRYDFYRREFDSLGMEAVSRAEVVGTTSTNGFEKLTTFGFRPRFFGLKYKTNLLNGNFSLNSRKRQFLPYTLDRIFSEDELAVESDANGNNSFVWKNGTTLYPDESLRYIGRNPDFGNYDRIFYDSSGTEDNFIIDMVNDFHMWSPMLPIDKSYDTYDDEIDDNSMNVVRS